MELVCQFGYGLTFFQRQRHSGLPPIWTANGMSRCVNNMVPLRRATESRTKEDPIQHDLLVGQVVLAQPQPFNGTFARHSRADSRALTKAGAWLKLN